MRIIERYLLRQFVQVFMICFISMTGLFIVFHAFSNLDEFMRATEKEGNLMLIMGEYYAYRAVYFFDQTSGILALISAMFTVTWIQRHNELTALAAAGVSTGRVIKPVIFAAIAVSCIAALSRETVIPAISVPLSREAKDLSGDKAHAMQPMYDQKTDILFRGQQTFAKDQRIEGPNFLLPSKIAGFGKQLIAENALYETATKDHPDGYRVKGVRQPENLAELPSAHLGDRPVIIAPRDGQGWLAPNECFVVSDVNFDQLTGGTRYRQFSSTWQLARGLHNPSLDFGADVRVAIHARVTQPFLDITLLFLGLPLILSRENRNVFVAIGLCVAVVTVFMLILLGSQALGRIYLISPALAAWLPLVIFVPVAVNMAEPLRV